MEVSFTHAQTGTYFGGNMSLINSQYKRKLDTIFEGKEEDVIYHDSVKGFYILNFPILTERVALVIKGDDKGRFSYQCSDGLMAYKFDDIMAHILDIAL